MANQFLGLSLFIMLLSFFIIMNALSSFESTKSKPVLNSLTLAFSNKQSKSIQSPGISQTPDTRTQLGSTLDQIEGLFQSQITAAQTKQNRFGSMMHIRIPFKDFKKAIDFSLNTAPDRPFASETAHQVDLLPMLVSLMETSRATPYKMDMILNIEEEPADISDKLPQTFNTYNKSISTLTQKIEAAGLPKKQISMGLKKAQSEADIATIELFFRRYEPFNPNPGFTQNQ